MAATIISIEDEERIAHWMQLYLEQAGFTTSLASDGLAGLALVQQHQPSFVVLDVMLQNSRSARSCCRVACAYHRWMLASWMSEPASPRRQMETRWVKRHLRDGPREVQSCAGRRADAGSRVD